MLNLHGFMGVLLATLFGSIKVLKASILGLIQVFSYQPGGTTPAYQVNAAAVIKGKGGVLYRIVCVAPGTGGNLVLNDCATTGAAAASNEILTVPNTGLAVGQVITLEWPCNTGIVVSSVPTGGGNFSVSYA